MNKITQQTIPQAGTRLLRITLAVSALAIGSNLALASDKTPRVVGGEPAAPDQFPWQAAVIFNNGDTPYNSLHCGGSIINANWILSAAHCADDGANAVFVGSNSLEDTSTAQIIPIKRWVAHPGYVEQDTAQAGEVTFDNDIALIELETPIDFDACGSHCATIETVTADEEAEVAPLAGEAYVSGWGDMVSTDSGSPSYYPPELQWTTLSIADCTTSPSLYAAEEISPRMLCANVSDFSRDSCSGDSGGPLVVANSSGTGYLQEGVVSWGSGCASMGYPGVYTRLSQFSSWISSVINPTPAKKHKSGGVLVLWPLLGLPLLARRPRRHSGGQA